mgnify:CR=1 FL=1
MQENDREVIIYKDDKVTAQIYIDSIEVDEDEDMLYFSYDITDGEPQSVEELGPLIAEFLKELIVEYAEKVINSAKE